jgi:hypothetical protein
MKASTAFDTLFGDDIQGDNTISCILCGYTLYGDDPQIPVVCVNCLQKFENGVIVNDRVISFESAVHEDIDWSNAIPVTTDTHPDGYTCDITGEVFGVDN